MAGNYKPSFDQKVRSDTAVNLARPTCLNFKTKTNLRRIEVLQILSKITFKTKNGVAQMRNRSIDITCKTRENLLELHAKLKRYRIYLQSGALRSSELKHIIWVGTDPQCPTMQ